MIDNLNIIVAKYKETKRKAIEEMKNEFKKYLNSVFEQVLTLGTIVIIQYTPYYDDGELCEFAIQDIGYVKKDDDISIDDLWDYALSRSEFNGNSILTELNSFIYKNKELMKLMFGNHVVIKITKYDITVDQYEHE